MILDTGKERVRGYEGWRGWRVVDGGAAVAGHLVGYGRAGPCGGAADGAGGITGVRRLVVEGQRVGVCARPVHLVWADGC